MADLNKENDNEHLNQPITDEYSSPHLWDKRESRDRHSTKFYGSIVVRAVAIEIAMRFIILLPLDRDVL